MDFEVDDLTSTGECSAAIVISGGIGVVVVIGKACSGGLIDCDIAIGGRGDELFDGDGAIGFWGELDPEVAIVSDDVGHDAGLGDFVEDISLDGFAADGIS